MPATRDGKTWRSQFYYEDWQGVRHKKNKRGFKTKAEAEEWERNFRQQQRKDLDINFENFVEIYFTDVENRLRESTIKNKRYVFDLKVTPYFKKKKMCEIKTSDIRAWQNELIKQGYAPTYLKSINNQELICKGWFLPPNTYDCGSFVVNRKAVVGKEQKKPYNRYKFNTERSFCL